MPIAQHDNASPAASNGPMLVAGPVMEDGKRLTGKQEAFALAVAKGNSLSGAYRQAYDHEGMNDQTVWSKASIEAAKVNVRARIDEHILELNSNTLHAPADIRAMVLRNLQDLANDKTCPESVRARCNELLGKVRGVDLFSAGTGSDDAKATKADMRALGDRLSKLIPQPVDIIDASPFRPKDDGSEPGKA
jgi:hypothetical protein